MMKLRPGICTPGRPGIKGRITPLKALARNRSGSTAVEFSVLVFPFMGLIIGIFQFYALHLMQDTLSETLFQSASNPEAVLLAGDKAGYAAIVCQKAAFPGMCTSSLKLEMQPIQNAPLVKTAITGTTFNPGTSNDVLLVRATIEVTSFIPVIPTLTARASALFRRPLS